MSDMAHTRILGYIAPYIETLIGLDLITGVLTRLSEINWGLMSIVYIVVKAQVILIQGRIIPCGCFPGPLSKMLMTQSVLIDIVSLLACTQIILARGRKFFTLGSLIPENWQYRLCYIW
jgi:hypothetical protein